MFIHDMMKHVQQGKGLTMKRSYTKWNLPMVLEEANKYQSRSEFRDGNSVAYRKALQWGLMDQLFPIEVVYVEKIRPVKVKQVVKNVMVSDRVDKFKIEDDVRFILGLSDWENTLQTAARDYKGAELDYYWEYAKSLLNKRGL